MLRRLLFQERAMTTYPMSDEDRAIQDRARGFVDELIPYEVEAEMNSGEIDPAVGSSSTTVRSSSACSR
jgi:hypothetical protein